MTSYAHHRATVAGICVSVLGVTAIISIAVLIGIREGRLGEEAATRQQPKSVTPSTPPQPPAPRHDAPIPGTWQACVAYCGNERITNVALSRCVCGMPWENDCPIVDHDGYAWKQTKDGGVEPYLPWEKPKENLR